MQCKQCTSSFESTDWDLQFYKKMDMPEPTLCPDCRQQQRWAVRNQETLYKRTCDLTGEEMVSLYSPDKPYKVYKEDAWWSDQWDPIDYGHDFDFNRPFFEQYNELMHDVPRRGMHQDGSNEGSQYTTFGMNNRNCYLTFACFFCEDVYCSTWTGFTKDSMDCLIALESSLLYECTNCSKCYECFYCRDCKNCYDSYLLEDCNGCKHCIGCKNLRNKEYHIYNKPVSKEEFESFKKKLFEKGFEKERTKFDEWKLSLPYPANHIENSEDCTGDYIENAKNCHDCFDIVLGAEDLRYCQYAGWKGRDMVDCTMAGKEAELIYQMHATVASHRCAFGSFIRSCSDIFYCDSVMECEHCFGCTGLRHKKYCILNKQYSKENYFKLKAKIIEHMKKSGEWGQFFPPDLSPFGYNETMAQIFFPLSKEKALKKGFKWSDYEAPVLKVEKIVTASKLPEHIKDVPDDVLNWAIECEVTQKPFKIIPQELAFYRKMNLSLPHRHPDQRRKDRMDLRNPRKLWDRECNKCQKAIKTSYSPDRPEIVYCEHCYLKEVY